MSKDSWLNWYQDRRVEDCVRQFARVLKGEGFTKVLDFGCGTGRNSVYLANSGFEVYGFDWSEAAVNLARQELAKGGLSSDLRVWDMNKTPYPYRDGLFDGALVMRVMHHTYKKRIENIAAEIARIIKKKGLIYVEVPTYEKALKPPPEGASSVELEPGTFVPSTGDEAGIPHHHFKKDELMLLFSAFSPLTLEERYDHYCLTARRT